MGADPPGSFEPAEDGTVLQTLKCSISSDKPLYVSISHNELKEVPDGDTQYLALRNACRELAGRIKITTPDPYFNTLGGALAVAADGIWGEEGVWLHGAVGWRMPLSGWRAAYVGDVLGWHDRARTHLIIMPPVKLPKFLIQFRIRHKIRPLRLHARPRYGVHRNTVTDIFAVIPAVIIRCIIMI